MRRLVVVALAAVFPLAALAQEAAPAGAPTGLAATFSLGGGGELGLDEGKAGVFELEAAIGYEIPGTGLRPELAAAFGLAPDSHVALRPGAAARAPRLSRSSSARRSTPSNARDGDFDWRWLLVGVAAELRFTSLLGLYVEVDTGAKLSSRAGLPLLVRAGASFRF